VCFNTTLKALRWSAGAASVNRRFCVRARFVIMQYLVRRRQPDCSDCGGVGTAIGKTCARSARPSTLKARRLTQYDSHVKWFARFSWHSIKINNCGACVTGELRARRVNKDFRLIATSKNRCSTKSRCTICARARNVALNAVRQYPKGLKEMFQKRGSREFMDPMAWPHLYAELQGIARVR
jgi:hypothetical protein